MGYSYDSSSKEIRQGGNKVGWAALAAVATSVIVILTAILTGSPAGLLTTFSSIPEPPVGITWWDKELLRDDYPIPWGDTAVVTQGTTLQIADVMTSTEAFTLVETWDGGVLGLTGFITTTGTVITGANSLTWTGAAPGGALVKAWAVLTNTWSTSRITETLTTSGGSKSVVVYLELGQPPATPTPAPTVYVSPTPRYTPRPWPTVMYPTATPCVGMGCTPLNPGDTVPYSIYVPLVMRNYWRGPERP